MHQVREAVHDLERPVLARGRICWRLSNEGPLAQVREQLP
jgi:hypothetical protein